jgi:hypothetical protein
VGLAGGAVGTSDNLYRQIAALRAGLRFLAVPLLLIQMQLLMALVQLIGNWSK